MSKAPLTLPTSFFIFKNLTAHGFWQTQWNAEHSIQEREALLQTLSSLIGDGKLEEPDHEIITIERRDSDDVATEKIRALMDRMAMGRYGKKVLLQLEAGEAP
jgi:hypothetical protein